ncbi:hypothetical protein JCM10908_006116 [Rhodotorula pacifica]|uniref:uncharacterized protein n=1 Tax=Rhodotorula pacifica TaxID=1495444 RepID=UPI00316CC766
MGGFVSTAAQTAVNALPSIASLRADHALADGPGSRHASPAGGAAPSYTDVLEVLEILQQLNLPVELAIDILDAAFVISSGLCYHFACCETLENDVAPSYLATFAILPYSNREYYPAITAQWTGNQVASAGPRGNLVRATVLVTPQLPDVPGAPEHYVKRVAVWTDSRDQGFSSFAQFRGTRKGSSSWFDLVLLRPSELAPDSAAGSPADERSSAPSEPHEAHQPVASIRLHCNIHASHIFSQYISTLPRRTPTAADDGVSADPEEEQEDDGAAFLAQLRPGDRLAVVACAQYPMWVNAVRGCAIKVEMKVI